jgi:CRISPR-associated protein Csx14
MSQTPEWLIRVRLEPTNPGQFFACCGLLELAHRLWGGAEGWFEDQQHHFCMHPQPFEPQRAPDYSPLALYNSVAFSLFTNIMTESQLQRREHLLSMPKKRIEADLLLESEKKHSMSCGASHLSY